MLWIYALYKIKVICIPGTVPPCTSNSQQADTTEVSDTCQAVHEFRYKHRRATQRQYRHHIWKGMFGYWINHESRNLAQFL